MYTGTHELFDFEFNFDIILSVATPHVRAKIILKLLRSSWVFDKSLLILDIKTKFLLCVGAMACYVQGVLSECDPHGVFRQLDGARQPAATGGGTDDDTGLLVGGKRLQDDGGGVAVGLADGDAVAADEETQRGHDRTVLVEGERGAGATGRDCGGHGEDGVEGWMVDGGW